MQAFLYLKRLSFLSIPISFLLVIGNTVFGQLSVGNDSGYYEKPGVDIMVFSSQYNGGIFFDEKTAGKELIHHGVRTAANGAVCLQNAPEQWDRIPVLPNLKVDKAGNTIEATIAYKKFSFSPRLIAAAKGAGIDPPETGGEPATGASHRHFH